MERKVSDVADVLRSKIVQVESDLEQRLQPIQELENKISSISTAVSSVQVF